MRRVNLLTSVKNQDKIRDLSEQIGKQTYSGFIDWFIDWGTLQPTNVVTGMDKRISIKSSSGTNSLSIPNITINDNMYYYPDSIEYMVNQLENQKYDSLCCMSTLIYNTILQKLYKGNLLTNKKPCVWRGNSKGQPKDYLEPEHVGVYIDESSDYIDQMVSATMDINPRLVEIKDISFYLPHNVITQFSKEPTLSIYDIEYFAGGFSIKWDPKDQSLGGSEQAIVNLASSWALMGKKVAVYGEVVDTVYNGVEYFNWRKFKYQDQHNLVILWRLYGLLCGAPFAIKSKQLWLDLHDYINKTGQFNDIWNKYNGCIDKVMFKSQFHKDEFEKMLEIRLDTNKYAIIPNGVRVSEFSRNTHGVERNPYRFCYCSCYTRGLMEILMYLWPLIYRLEPRAELHVYYGMNGVTDESFKGTMTKLLSSYGVMDHGRQPMDMIIREKYSSTFHLYITDSLAEIDCITIRESLATGCIPLLSNSNLFKDRDGVHFDLPNKLPQTYQQIAIKILHLMRQEEQLSQYRQEFRGSKTLSSWKETADSWLGVGGQSPPIPPSGGICQ